MGFTPPCCSHGQRSAVHPHVRGVYGLLKGGLVIPIPTHVGFTIPNGHAGCGKTGPSPHAWGLRGIQARRHPPLRFIPTCVGFTFVPASEPLMVPVHPHIRGVYAQGDDYGLQKYGPSPHTWGLRSISAVGILKNRSIPTYVGFTGVALAIDHWISGPSPHTWGLLPVEPRGRPGQRSIPTYVGFTWWGQSG